MTSGISVIMSVSRRPMVSMRYPLRRQPKGVPAALKLAGKETQLFISYCCADVDNDREFMNLN